MQVKRFFALMTIAALSAFAFQCDADANGTKVYNESGYQWARFMEITTDGGVIILSETSGNGGANDLQIKKTDALGNVQWEKTRGGSGYEYPAGVLQTEDGGYIIAGETQSQGPGDPNNHGSYGNFWLFKLDANGNQVWEHVYGTESRDGAAGLARGANGGYLLAGFTHSTEEPNYFVVKTDDQGNEEWRNNYALNGVTALANSVTPTADGGFVLAGTTGNIFSESDAWFLKIDASGNIVWSETYGNPLLIESVKDIQPTTDGGFIAAGYRENGDGNGEQDAWILRLDQNGELLWENTYGGANEDSAASIQQTNEGGFIFAGTTRSYGFQNNDAYLVKLTATGAESWYRNIGGTSAYDGTIVRQKSNGGYALAGFTYAGISTLFDIFVMKLDSNGE